MATDIPITERQFIAYEDVRESGITNMFDTKTVSDLSLGILTSNDALEVIKHYNALCELYPHVRNGS